MNEKDKQMLTSVVSWKFVPAQIVKYVNIFDLSS